MKLLLSNIFLLLCTTLCNAQNDVIPDVAASNSFEGSFKNKNLRVSYKYIDSTQTHDYSGNWDFDFDGKTDNLYFIGNGGAHVYYHLQIILSATMEVKDFPFLLSDYPLLEILSYLKEQKFYPPPVFPQFVVDDFDADGQDEIFFSVYKNTFDIIKDDLKKYDVTSRYILIDFKGNEIVLKNFME